MPVGVCDLFTFTFSRRFYPKRLTYVQLTMYTHFTFTLMAHCTSGAIRGSVSCSRTLRPGIELATFCLLNDFFISCTTVAPKRTAHMQLNMIHMNTTHLITAHLNTAHLTSVLPTNSLYLGVPPRYINNHKSIFGDFDI